MRAVPALLLAALPLWAAPPKPPTVKQLQAEVQRLTEERDDLKQRLAGMEDQQQELTAARKARDAAKAEAESARKDADQARASLRENQGGGEAILKELQEARQAVQGAQQEAARLRTENEALRQKTSGVPGEGDLVVLGEDVVAARPVNLNRVTPRLKAPRLFSTRPKGVVVVQVLVSEKGDVLAARLLQGLPDHPDAAQAHEACLEAAKRLVFDPATSKDGRIHYKVWQGVGFFLD